MLLIVSPIVLFLLVGVPNFVSGATQVDLRLGKDDFFLGEKFVITLTDVIYGIVGMCIGFITAITYLLLSDFGTFKRRIATEQEEEEDNTIREGRLIGSKKYPVRALPFIITITRTVKQKKECINLNWTNSSLVDHPSLIFLLGEISIIYVHQFITQTHVEERVLKAIHTEPDNYVANSEEEHQTTWPIWSRQGRIMGTGRLPVGYLIIFKRFHSFKVIICDLVVLLIDLIIT